MLLRDACQLPARMPAARPTPKRLLRKGGWVPVVSPWGDHADVNTAAGRGGEPTVTPGLAPTSALANWMTGPHQGDIQPIVHTRPRLETTDESGYLDRIRLRLYHR